MNAANRILHRMNPLAQLVKLPIDVLDRCRDENADLAAQVFELSQTLREQWLTADYAAKRRKIEIVCSNGRLDEFLLPAN
jgi:uncharacterized protein YoxC